MIVKYNTKKLQSVLNDFHQITGIAIALCDTQLRYIVKSTSIRGTDFCDYLHALDSGEGCSSSDRMLFTLAAQSKTPQIHRCHRGLWDMCVPVQKDGTLLAYMIMGRIRVSERLPDAVRQELSPSQLQRADALYLALPLYTERSAHAAARLASVLATYILAEDLILTQKNEEAQRLAAYIDAHLPEDLCAARICRDMHLSKTMLYRLFAANMGCGINQYVTARRLEVAKDLLAHSDISVSEVGERVGITNYPYFCRLFKKRTGITPLQYRKNK